MFIGYPRSGHSIVGALLNAHRDAVISHELVAAPIILRGCTRDELYSRILARAHWWNLRGNKSNYVYQVPRQWQGRFATLRVIGDKRGGAVARCLGEHPDFLQRVRSLVKVPLRLVHIVRNPFDNISAISIAQGWSLPESIEFYFSHCRTTSTLNTQCDPSELITLHHEAMIREPVKFLTNLCAYLSLERYPNYLEDCGRIIFRKPTYPRRKVAWSAALVGEVERRAQACPFLEGYRFKFDEEESRLLSLASAQGLQTRS